MTRKALSVLESTNGIRLSVLSFMLSCSVLALGNEPPNAESVAAVQSCRGCHQRVVDTYVGTAHFQTSQHANATSIKGGFEPGRNILKTSNPNVYFKMEKRRGAFYQTAYRSVSSKVGSRTERFNLVIGSGRKGQSYAYWKRGLLFQLPVSYLAAVDGWANSPGMIDGQIFFDRFISPRCLECHATMFRAELKGEKARYSSNFVLGLSCEKCHGDTGAHVAFHTKHPLDGTARFVLNPADLSRERKLDQCSLCHSGAAKSIRQPFSYRPGEPLSAYLEIPPVQEDVRPDVHANQVGLLRLSECFAATESMSCSTCHNVHKEERDLSAFARTCVRCHEPTKCRIVREVGQTAQEHCVPCHMPNERSNLITIDSGLETFAQSYRNHRIAVYGRVTDTVLKRLTTAEVRK